MKIVFFGSDSFGIPALEKLKGISQLLIITEHDRPKGRGRKFSPLPPKTYALNNDLRFLETENCNDNYLVEQIREFKPDFFVVASFGQLLKKTLLAIPKYFPLNIHPSLLPLYRGAAPIRRAIMEGETKTGVSIIKMDKKLDSGGIILQDTVPIDDTTIYTELSKTLAELGAVLLVRSINSIVRNTYSIAKQDDSLATYAKKIKNSDSLLNLKYDSGTVLRQINAFSEKPGVTFKIKGRQFKIIHAIRSEHKLQNGKLEVLDKHLFLGTSTNAIEILKIQPAGKSIMAPREFLNGYTKFTNTLLDGE